MLHRVVLACVPNQYIRWSWGREAGDADGWHSSLLNTHLVPVRPTSVVSEVCQAGPIILWKKTRPKLAVGRQQVASERLE